MTDTPGREPGAPEPGGAEPTGPDAAPEQRLPATRPPAEVAPVERFTSPPSIRSVELSPERVAQVVRQSSNARWVGFLATVIVILFVALYWFYELGAPLGLTQPRLEAEITAQQVTAVERGYLVYEANCARCHGEQGEGGAGPILNRQDKLFSHLNENYIKNVLTVGGRYVCGDPKSAMPVWADTGNPPGPLNYRQIEELIAFLLATNDTTYIVRDEHLLDPKVNPMTGEVETFKGWRDPNYVPEPGATPYPDCWSNEFASGSSASPGPSVSIDPNAEVVNIAALNIAFDPTEVTAPADAPFTLRFDNQDAGIQHNVEIKDSAGTSVFKGEIFPGAGQRDYAVPALAAGAHPFVCTVHPNMTGTLTAQ
jgi:mono/diheme cytochrome c family protein/plastocyanin